MSRSNQPPSLALPGQATFVFLAYMLFLAWVAMPQGMATEYRLFGVSPLTPLATNAEMQAALGSADAGSYARGAVEMAEKGWIHTPGYLTLWPPGMFVIHAIGLRLLGSEGPAILFLIFSNVVAWSAAFLQIFLLARRALPRFVAVLLPLVFVAFPFFREYLLGHGLTMSEGIAIAVWATGILAVLRGALEQRVGLGVSGGVTIAAAAFLRGQMFGTMMVGSALLAVLVVIVAAIGLLRRSPNTGRLKTVANSLSRARLATPIACALVFHACTLPYLVHNRIEYGRLEWLFLDYYYRYMWLLPEEYTGEQRFILQGGGPVACHVAPMLCGELRTLRNTHGESAVPFRTYRRLAMRELFEHPFAWFAFRAKHLPPYWFSGPSVVPPVQSSKWPGYLLASLLAFSIVSPWWLRRNPILSPLLYAMGSAYAGTLAIIALAHFEVRYLYHIQFSAILFAIVTACLLVEQLRAKDREAIR